MSDDLIHDRASWRDAWDDDDPEVTRIARRVGAALNSGRDKAVVDVVLDEVQTMRARIELLQAALNVALYYAEGCPDSDPDEVAGCRVVLDAEIALDPS